MRVEDYCFCTDYCLNYGIACLSCAHSPNHSSNAPDKFVSCKCGSQSSLCARRHDIDACYDCDPFDPPCSLFKCGVSFNG